MKILVTDPIISRFAAILRSGGHDPLLAAGRPDEEIVAALRDADVMVCSRMTEPMARAGAGLRLVQAARRDPGAPLEPGLDLERVVAMGELPTLLATSDVVVVTVPLNPHTRGLIGAEELRVMRRSTFLVNVSRGPVVDERALYDALAGDRIAGAAIDVWWPTDGVSRGGATLPFGELDNVVLTPHNSGHTTETFESRARDIAANLSALEAGRPLRNVVRAPKINLS